MNSLRYTQSKVALHIPLFNDVSTLILTYNDNEGLDEHIRKEEVNKVFYNYQALDQIARDMIDDRKREALKARRWAKARKIARQLSNK